MKSSTEKMVSEIVIKGKYNTSAFVAFGADGFNSAVIHDIHESLKRDQPIFLNGINEFSEFKARLEDLMTIMSDVESMIENQPRIESPPVINNETEKMISEIVIKGKYNTSASVAFRANGFNSAIIRDIPESLRRDQSIYLNSVDEFLEFKARLEDLMAIMSDIESMTESPPRIDDTAGFIDTDPDLFLTPMANTVELSE